MTERRAGDRANGCRVLVTGASGFIGRHALAPLRERGFEVHAVCRHRLCEGEGVVWHETDLLAPDRAAELLERVRPAHLLHLAWYAVPGLYWTSSENARWLEASLDLVRSFARHGGRRLVVAGSCAEYDWRSDGTCDERTTPLLPSTPYGKAKLELQRAIDAGGFDAAWGRVFHCFGPHERPERFVPSVVRSLLKGERVKCSHGNQLRDFLYVEDLGDAFAALLDSSVRGAINLGSGTPITIRALATRLAQKLAGDELLDFGAVPPGDPPVLVPRLARQEAELAWAPRQTFESALDATIAYWREVEGIRA